MYSVQYINLHERFDRRCRLEELFGKSSIFTLHRFNAIKHKDGAIGCTLSHLKLLKQAMDENWDYFLVIEDDFMVDDFCLFENKFKSIIESKMDFDVLLLGGNILPPYVKTSKDTVRIHHSQTTVGYMVKKHYYQTLYRNIKEGLYYLMKIPNERVKYAIDKYWIKLQKRDKWLLIYPLMVYQHEDYSDIEGRNVDYKNLMLDPDKEAWVKAAIRNKNKSK